MPRGVYPRTAQARANISASLKGNTRRKGTGTSAKGLANMSAAMRGRRLSAAHKAKLGLASTTHGHGGPSPSPTYRSWQGMKSRCSNSNHKQWKDYGGRGIGVCQRWLDSFENFLADMGERPDELTLDRINNEGHYEPSNCHWATRSQQQRNRRPVNRSSKP